MSHVPPPGPPQGPPHGPPQGPGYGYGPPPPRNNDGRTVGLIVGAVLGAVAAVVAVVAGFIGLFALGYDSTNPEPAGYVFVAIAALCLLLPIVLAVVRRTRWWGVGMLIGFFGVAIIGGGSCAALIAAG